jgi:tRNA(Ile)-lysidine synthase
MSQEKNSVNFEDRFHSHLISKNLWKKNDFLYVACSGGVDSVVLAHLLKSLSIPFEILHCNFNLRGDESIRDEAFVKSLADLLGVEIHVKSFNTKDEMTRIGKGIQETARILRYTWFEEMINAKHTKGSNAFLLTAHHQDDQVETIAMNFFRGTGIAGLRGMQEKLKYIIRPLLIFSRKELTQYAELKSIAWVEDSSNIDIHYTRNFFRHSVLETVKKVYPEVESNLVENAKRFAEIEFIYKLQIEKIKAGLIEKNEQGWKIPVKKLMLSTPLDTIMFELFSEFGFSADQSIELKKLFIASTGKSMQSATHRVLRNRDWLLINLIDDTEKKLIVIEEGMESVTFGNHALGLKQYDKSKLPDANPNKAWMDAKHVTYPLILRPWKPGDYFYPLGMKKKKKISRFLTDLKISKKEKEDQWVIESDKKIIWVVGRRIDDRVKVIPSTNAIIFIESLIR